MAKAKKAAKYLGTGTARKAAKKTMKRKSAVDRRLNSIMRNIRSGRKN